MAGPVTSESVRASRGHDRRSKAIFYHLDRKREEAHVEQVKFEHAVYEGRFRDPTIELGGNAPEEGPPEYHGWLGEATENLGRSQQVAARILFGIEQALRKSHGKLQHIFKHVNAGTKGVLEPEEFLEGLIRIGIIHSEELTVEDIVDVMNVIDPAFDGRINFGTLSRALSSAATVHRQRRQDSERLAAHNQLKIKTTLFFLTIW